MSWRSNHNFVISSLDQQFPVLMPHIPNFRLSKRQVSLYLHHWRFLGSKRRVWGTLAILHSVVEPRQLPSLALDRPIGHCPRRPSPSPLGSVASSVPETSLDRSFKQW